MTEKQIVLVDFSSIAHPIWHMAASDPNPDATSIRIIAKVRALTSGQPHAAICLDSKASFRKELDASYKAARESKPAPFFHQCALAIEALKGDGFPMWEAYGFEADDVIASAVEQAKVGHWPVLIVSADKDTLALVNEHVSVKSPITGNIMTPEGVKEKFGVMPHQIRDYLTLVGDASDGVVGVKGIGAKWAALLLNAFGNLDDMYRAIDIHESNVVKPSQTSALEDFRPRLPIVRQLIALRTDAPIDFAAVLKDRQPTDTGDEIMQDIEDAMPTIDEGQFRLGQHPADHPTQRELTPEEATKSLGAFVADVARRVAPTVGPVHKVDVRPIAPAVENQIANQRLGFDPAPVPLPENPRMSLVPVTGDYERQLEPQSMNQAVQLAGILHKARLFNGYGSPEAVLSTVLAGRELGISAMASLRSFHIVEGKPTMAADALRALVLKSGKAKSFRCTERTPIAATFTTTRENEEPMELRYTIEEAQAAGLVKNGSGWTKNPADMLVARASSKLARLVYPDVVAGLYAPEEF